MKPGLAFTLVAAGLLGAPAEDAPPRSTALSLFDGKTFTGWEGDTQGTWRIEEGEIVAGDVSRNQPRNEFLATTRRFEDFELRLKIKLLGTEGFVNAGIQFRTERIPNHHEVSGYQADFGAGFDGALYDESRRNKVLAQPSAEVRARALRPGEWNDYRIRAEGPRIRLWLNGIPTVDYTEEDPAIPRTGIIALQIHGGARSQVRYRDLEIEELGQAALAGSRAPVGAQARLTDRVSEARLEPFPGGRLELRRGETVVLCGPENVVAEQRTGWIESQLALAWRELAPSFRHMGWEGDTVYRQNRMEAWGSWKENLEAVGATVVIGWFGQLEALDDRHGVEDFTRALSGLLDAWARRTPRIVLLGPCLFEAPGSPGVVDNTPRNDRVRQHAEIIRRLAAERGLGYVDLLAPFPEKSPSTQRWSRDGYHLTDEGLREVGRHVAAALGGTPSENAPREPTEELRRAVVEKNRLWFDTWRCMNWAFAYGDRTTQPFARGAGGRPDLVEELRQYRPLLEHAEQIIHSIAEGRPLPPPLPPPPSRADPPAPTPAEEAARFKVRDGFSVELFADESLGVVRPVQIRWDESGTLWVACAPAYPQLQPGERANDYLLRVVDRNGDGRADEGSRFAEGLTMPLGFEFGVWQGVNGVFVCESTQLVFLRDEDGDGRADARSVVLSGFGTGDTHQTINSLRWGPDGALWFTQGYHIWSYVETPRGIVELNRSGIWRFNPRTLRLDSFLNESAAGLNCWGTAWDDSGQIFHGSGADFSIWHTAPAIIPTLHPLGLGPGLARSTGKSMEPEILGSSHLPPELRGVLLKSTYYTSQVQLYRLKDSGSGFTSEDLGDLLSSSGNELRPVETRVGPDGAIYVCDWLNPVIGHYQASYRDPRRDRSHGRIWRLTARARPTLAPPRLESLDVPGLVSRLSSPERWERTAARHALYLRPTSQVLPVIEATLQSLLADRPAGHEALLLELSGVFAAHESPRPALVLACLASPDFHWRAWGAHLLGVWAESLGDVPALLRRAVEDEHPRVRLEGVVACSWAPRPLGGEAALIATLALERPIDFGIDYALTQCLHALLPAWEPALSAGKLDLGGRPAALARLLLTVGQDNVMPRLRELARLGGATGADREAILALLAERGTVEDQTLALEAVPASRLVLDALARGALRGKSPGRGPVVTRLLESPLEEARIAGCRVAPAWSESPGTIEKLRALASHKKASSPERAAALRALGDLGGQSELSTVVQVAEAGDAALRGAALEAELRHDPGAASERAARWLADTRTAEEAGLILGPFLARRGGGERLARALSLGRPTPAAAERALQWLGEAGRSDVEVRAELRAAAGSALARREHSEELVRRIVEEARRKGDAGRGRTVFRAERSTCLKCHRLGDEGGNVGPDLSALARAMPPELIVESVLWPARQVKEGYLLTTIVTRDGAILSGARESESEKELLLRLVPGGERQVVPRDEIEERADAGTAMPDGLLDGLAEGDQLDLFKFLFELGVARN